MKPIFFAWTRSFWLFAATGILIVTEVGEPLMLPLAGIAAPLLGWDVPTTVDWLNNVFAVLALLAGAQQRAGASRPYTARPTPEAFQ